MNREESHVQQAVHKHERRVAKHLNEEFDRTTTRGDRFSDWVARRVGSWTFIGLNLLLSFQAAYTAPFIMMSANRQSLRDRMEAEVDFAINYTAENEIMMVMNRLQEIVDELKAVRQENQEHKLRSQGLQQQNAELRELIAALHKA